jgi:hypothetical protein
LNGYGAYQAYRKVVEEEYMSGDDYAAFELHRVA